MVRTADGVSVGGKKDVPFADKSLKLSLGNLLTNNMVAALSYDDVLATP